MPSSPILTRRLNDAVRSLAEMTGVVFRPKTITEVVFVGPVLVDPTEPLLRLVETLEAAVGRLNPPRPVPGEGQGALDLTAP